MWPWAMGRWSAGEASKATCNEGTLVVAEMVLGIENATHTAELRLCAANPQRREELGGAALIEAKSGSCVQMK
ncbi:hypothetical protein BCR44DRAFT_1426231 [Catenaria anguillulae PL171]|uniref:Uncharacterized protein n=1 Tax=Catenaria anguillulae PL171 TaxID=765915 RepID=A0A1Y2I019_9FUNG|nr:hypothetical protein BCR44DRAFT_1426231 [Catenaria anguillulae PL171]